MLTDADIRSLLREECCRAGSVQKWARKHGFGWSRVYAVLAGEKPGPKLLKALGYKKVVRYEADVTEGNGG